jgi:hypothetical protein
MVGIAVLAPACGSAASSAHDAPPVPQVSQVAVARNQAAQMVLTTGDLMGYTMRSDSPETLSEQLPSRRTPHYGQIERMVRANWLASEHSIVISPNGKVQLFSDANIFRSAVAARRIWKLEGVRVPGTRERRYPAPAEAPNGARLDYMNDGHHAGFELSWPQGRVIGFTIVYARPADRFSRTAAARVGAFLATAAQAQAQRIDHVLSGAGT